MDRHLRQLVYALVVVPYWEWDQVRGDEAAEVGYLLVWTWNGLPDGPNVDSKCVSRGVTC